MAKKPAEVPLEGTVTLTGSQAQAIAAGAADAKPARKQPPQYIQLLAKIDRLLAEVPIGLAMRTLAALTDEYTERNELAIAASAYPAILLLGAITGVATAPDNRAAVSTRLPPCTDSWRGGKGAALVLPLDPTGKREACKKKIIIKAGNWLRPSLSPARGNGGGRPG